jgi:glycosyl transferase family 25
MAPLSSSSLSIPAFYINLDRDSIRRELLEKELARAGIAAERISAVDGRAVPDWLKSFYDGQMTPGEVGCSASHLAVYKTIRERGLPFALVLEDDARLADDFLSTIVSAIRMAPREWDVIRLIESSKPSQTVAKVGDSRTIVRYLRIPRSTTGLIVSARGAAKLLTRRLIKEPIDVEIRWPWQLDLNVYGIEPPLIIQASATDLATTIPVRSRPEKFNQVRRLSFNIRKMGFADYLLCRFGFQRRYAEQADARDSVALAPRLEPASQFLADTQTVK